MKNKQIESGLNRAIDQIAPDVYEKLLSTPVRKMQVHDHITQQSSTPISKSYRVQFASVFALFVMVIGIFIGWSQFFQTIGIVDLDVNPSIEININRRNRVINVEAKNPEALQILSGMNFKFVKVENAVDAIVGSMILNGYLTTQENALLVSIIMDQDNKAQQLEEAIVLRVNQFFPSEAKPTIYSQSLRQTQEIRSKASEFQISNGIMNLLQIIQQRYPETTIEQLLDLPLRQLFELAYGEVIDDDVERNEPVINPRTTTPASPNQRQPTQASDDENDDWDDDDYYDDDFDDDDDEEDDDDEDDDDDDDDKDDDYDDD